MQNKQKKQTIIVIYNYLKGVTKKDVKNSNDKYAYKAESLV